MTRGAATHGDPSAKAKRYPDRTQRTKGHLSPHVRTEPLGPNVLHGSTKAVAFGPKQEAVAFGPKQEGA